MGGQNTYFPNNYIAIVSYLATTMMDKKSSTPKEVKFKEKTILILEDSIVNEKVIEELTFLFQVIPPSVLRKSCTDLVFSYLANTDPKSYTLSVPEVVEDFYCFLKFLEIAELYEQKHNS